MDAQPVKSEFAAVEVGVDQQGNGPRLRIEDLKSGRIGYLDALELETLAWLSEGALHPLLDPAALRFAEGRQQPSIAELVRRVYAALARGDRERLLELLAADFAADFAAGMPVVDRRPIRSAEEMIENAWWPLGRAFQISVAPSDWIPCAGGRLLVVGRYEGRARSTGRTLEANLAHLWTAHGGTLAHLWHLTDTAAWHAALQA